MATQAHGSHWAAALSERNLRWYLGGQVVSLTGGMLQGAVQALLVVSIVGKEHAATWAGLAWALNYAPGVVLSPFAGVLIDRFNKRTILLTTGALSASQALAFASLTYWGAATLLSINLLALLLGFVNAIDGPARNAIVKDAVGDPTHARLASKMFTSLYTVAQIMGPGLAGWFVVTIGYSSTFFINALTFVALALALGQMRLATKSPSQDTPPTLKAMCTGGSYVLHEPGIRLCIMITVAVCIFGYSVVLLLAVLNKYLWGGNELTYGYLAASNGAGALVGSVLLMRLECVSHKWLIVVGLAAQGVLVLVLATTESVWVACPLLFVVGIVNMISFSASRSSVIHIAKPELVGVVMGWNFSLMYLALIGASLGIGVLADLIGLSATLAISGGVLLALATAVPFLPGADELN